MIHILLFWIAQLTASAFAAWRGGAPERIVASLLVAATAATSLIPFEPGRTFYGVNWLAVGVDLGLLVAVTAVALRADRYWPLWMAGLQLLTLGVHGVRAYDPHIIPIVYARIAGEIAYPMLTILVIGTIRHHRRTRLAGPEAAWSRFHW